MCPWIACFVIFTPNPSSIAPIIAFSDIWLLANLTLGLIFLFGHFDFLNFTDYFLMNLNHSFSSTSNWSLLPNPFSQDRWLPRGPFSCCELIYGLSHDLWLDWCQSTIRLLGGPFFCSEVTCKISHDFWLGWSQSTSRLIGGPFSCVEVICGMSHDLWLDWCYSNSQLLGSPISYREVTCGMSHDLCLEWCRATSLLKGGPFSCCEVICGLWLDWC